MNPGCTTPTIVALVTPAGIGGLAVVRVSGRDALAAARALFPAWRDGDPPASHRAVHGLVVWPRTAPRDHAPPAGVAPGDPLDEVVALPFCAPRSYTGEDVVEFFCHGGHAAAHLVVDACLAAGAVPAAAGEFTRRAFLNGKLSLDQAEAVADLIHAEDTLAARAALARLRGGLDRELSAVEEPLLALQAELEGALEFTAAEDLARVVPARAVAVVDDALAHIAALLALAPAGRRLSDGVQVVLVGPTNVGKSSLFNALLGEERVLVDAEAGTTRDVVSASRVVGGLRFVLHDTAGLRAGGGRVEQLGMERTRTALGRADLVLHLVAADAEQTRQVLDLDVRPAAPPEAVVLDVVTRADLLDAEARARQVPAAPRLTSAVTGEGVAELWQEMVQAAGRAEMESALALGAVLNHRHRHRLERCRDELRALRADATASWPGDEVVASLLGGVLGELGEISGRVYTEKLLGEVFGRFCVGK